MTDGLYAPRLAFPSTAVIVTGGASGIGRATAEAVAAVGRAVAIWDLSAEASRAVAEDIVATYGVKAIGRELDVVDPAGYAAAVDEARAALGAIGGLVHCAGTVDRGSLEGIDVELWDRTMAVHLRALPLLIQALLPSLRAQPGSAVVAISSINATLGSAHNPIYTAAKGGILSLVRSLADRLAHDGIRINSVSPGYTRTPMMQGSIESKPDGHFESRVLLSRLAEPAEVARAIRFLLSDEASYVTAAELLVDGGRLSSVR